MIVNTNEIKALNQTNEGVTPEQIAKYLTLKTGEIYDSITGDEEFDGKSGLCVLIAPTSLGITSVYAKALEDGDFEFEAFNNNGDNVFDSEKMVFLWSFDMEFDEENGVDFVHKEGVANGTLCLNMLDKKCGYSEEEIAEMMSL